MAMEVDIDPAILAEYDTAAQRVGLGPAAVAEGRKELAAILRLGIPPDADTTTSNVSNASVPWVWLACALFLVSFRRYFFSAGDETSPPPELGPILKATGVHMEAFVGHLALLAQRLPSLQGEGEGPAAVAVNEAAQHLRHASLQTASVFAKCRQLWAHRHKLAPASDSSAHGPLLLLLDSDPSCAAAFTFVWYLYLDCKLRFVPAHAQSDLVAAFHLLLACLDFVLRHARGSGQQEEGEGHNVKAELQRLKQQQQQQQSRKRKGGAEQEEGAAAGGSNSAPTTGGPPAALMESLEEDAIAALFMMGGLTGGGASGAPPASPTASLSAAAASLGPAGRTGKRTAGGSKKVQQGLLEENAARVRGHVEGLVSQGVLRLGGDDGGEAAGIKQEGQEEGKNLARLFHPDVLLPNLRALRASYTTLRRSHLQSPQKQEGERALAALPFLLDERFVLTFPPAAAAAATDDDGDEGPLVALPPPLSTNTAIPPHQHLPSPLHATSGGSMMQPPSVAVGMVTPNSKGGVRPPHVFSTPHTSGRLLFQDYHDLASSAANAPLPSPFSPAPGAAGGLMLTPQKPPRPGAGGGGGGQQQQQQGLRTPVKSQSPHKGAGSSSPIAQTPVSAAMEALNWVNFTLEGLASGPSTKLMDYYKVAAAASTAANGSATDAAFFQQLVTGRLEGLLEKVTLTSSSTSTTNTNTKQAPSTSSSLRPPSASFQQPLLGSGNAREESLQRARRLGQALYYRVLQTMLDRESERLRSRDHSGLLQHAPFHGALLTCCLEVVLRALSLSTLAFPQLLARLDVQAYDFYKVQESFIKACPGLPFLLRSHLQEIEEQILARALWADVPAPSGATNSSTAPARVFKLMEEAERAGQWPVPALADGSGHNNGGEATAAAPMAEGGAEAAGEGAAAKALSQPRRNTSLDYVMRKVMLLAAQKVHALGRRLELPGEELDRVWTALKHSLRAHAPLLLRNRHLDHLVLCAFYAMGKVRKVAPEVTFKRTIEAYRKIPHPLLPSSSSSSSAHHYTTAASSSSSAAAFAVVKDIPLGGGPGGPRGDIIKFYNEVYIPALKSYILQFAPPSPSSSPTPPTAAAASSNAKENDVPPTDQQQQQRGGSPPPPPPAPAVGGGKAAPASPPVISPLPVASPSAHRSPQRIRQSNVYLTTCTSSSTTGAASASAGSPHRTVAAAATSSAAMPPNAAAAVGGGMEGAFVGGMVGGEGLLPMGGPQAGLSAAAAFREASAHHAPHHHHHHMMTPRTRVLYAFGESPAKDLDLINRAINRPHPSKASPSPSKKLTGDGAEVSSLQGRTQKRLRL